MDMSALRIENETVKRPVRTMGTRSRSVGSSLGRVIEDDDELFEAMHSSQPFTLTPKSPGVRRSIANPRFSSPKAPGLPGAPRRRKMMRGKGDQPNKSKQMSALQEFMVKAGSSKPSFEDQSLHTKQTTELTVESGKHMSSKSIQSKEFSVDELYDKDVYDRLNGKVTPKSRATKKKNNMSLDDFFKSSSKAAQSSNGKNEPSASSKNNEIRRVERPKSRQQRLPPSSADIDPQIPRVLMINNGGVDDVDDISLVSGMTDFSDFDTIQRKKSSQVRMKAKRQHYKDMLKKEENSGNADDDTA